MSYTCLVCYEDKPLKFLSEAILGILLSYFPVRMSHMLLQNEVLANQSTWTTPCTQTCIHIKYINCDCAVQEFSGLSRISIGGGLAERVS